MVDHALEQLSGLGCGIRFEQLPQEIVERTKQCLLDWLGVAIAGSRESVARRVAEYVHSEMGPRQASLIGSGARTSTVLAVLANSVAGHALDYDDVHLAIWGHPSATVIPAALALAETQHKSGRDLISAIVAGVEVACRFGEALTEAHYRAGWHATSTLGVFGSAAAAAHLLGLQENQWVHALSLAASQASGLQALFGTDVKPYQVAKAASGGVEAALLAAKGLKGRVDVVECARGFVQMYSGEQAALDQPDVTKFHVGSVLFKYHASCFGTHAAAEATCALRKTHSLSVDSLKRFEVYIPPRYLDICNVLEPRTANEAKFSVRFVCALALAGKRTDAIGVFSEEMLSDPIVRDLMSKITIMGDGDLPDAGARVIARVQGPEGLAERSAVADLGRAESDYHYQGRRLEEKFFALTCPVIGALHAKKIVDMVTAVETVDDVSSLFRLPAMQWSFAAGHSLTSSP